jgi:hypothetical protein
MIKIDDYASISMPNVWRGGIIPIRYMTLEDIGIEPDALQFHVLENASPHPVDQRHEMTSSPGSLIVEEAKQKLADAYSVPPEAVRIKIEL